MPGLSRLCGRNRFGATKVKASTFFVLRGKAWMEGTSPAMTVQNLRHTRAKLLRGHALSDMSNS